MVRDASSIAIGIVLPVMLILLFGYGLSLDVRDAPLAVVLEEPSPDATELAAALSAVALFRRPIDDVDAASAKQLMLSARSRRDRAHSLELRPRLEAGRRRGADPACTAPTPTGPESSRPMSKGRSATGLRTAPAEGKPFDAGRSAYSDRLWFNEANESRYFLVPGLIVLIMTLIGAFLTALVMAREWERGTLEALFVTPVRVGEILLGKTIPNFVLGMIGLALCMVTAKILVPRAAARVAVGADRRVDALSAGGVGHRAVDFGRRSRASLWPANDDPGHVSAGHDALGFLVRPAEHATCRAHRSPTPCRPDTSWRCCRPCFWRAMCGA